MVLVARFWLLAGSRLIVGAGLSTSSSPPALAWVWDDPADLLLASQPDTPAAINAATVPTSTVRRMVVRSLRLVSSRQPQLVTLGSRQLWSRSTARLAST